MKLKAGISFICALLCLTVCADIQEYAVQSRGNASLLTDFQRLQAFDRVLQQFEMQLEESDASTAAHVSAGATGALDSRSLHLFNLAMMYYERDLRWKQGGTTTALHYTEAALNASSNEWDPVYGDWLTIMQMRLQRAKLFSKIGCYAQSLTDYDAVLDAHHVAEEQCVDADSSQCDVVELPAYVLAEALHGKAEVLLSASNNTETAVSLLESAVQVYPCTHRSLLPLAQAMQHAGRRVSLSQWELFQDQLITLLDRTLVLPAQSKLRLLGTYNEYERAISTGEDNSSWYDYLVAAMEWLFAKSLGAVSKVSRKHRKQYSLKKKNTKNEQNQKVGQSSSGVPQVIHVAVHSNEVVDNVQRVVLRSCSFNEQPPSVGRGQLALHSISDDIHTVQASIYWALFTVNDVLYATHSLPQYQQQAWKYLQLARHSDRLRLRGEHSSLSYFTENTETALPRDKDILSHPTLYHQFMQLPQEEQLSLRQSVEQLQHIKSFFRKNYWLEARSAASRRTSLDIRPTPIFIVGFFRSGSTLLEHLLDAHSEIWGMGEHSSIVYDMNEMQEEMLAALSDHEKRYESTIHEMRQQRAGHLKMQQLQSKFEDELAEIYEQLIRRRAAIISGKMKARYQQMNNCSSSTVHNDSSSSVRYVVDKMLPNYFNIGLIHLVFPNAVIINMVRDPMDTLFSCYANRFGDPSVSYLLHDLPLVHRYVQYLKIIQHFRNVLPNVNMPFLPQEMMGKSNITRRRMQPLVDVQYEELVADPTAMLSRLLKYLGLQWEQEIASRIVDPSPPPEEEPQRRETVQQEYSGRVVETLSKLQVKNAVGARSVGRWLRYRQQLESAIVPSYRLFLPQLRAEHALPFEDKINWNASSGFNYTASINSLRSSTSS